MRGWVDLRSGGVTISPSFNIVPAGTHGLIGTNGGSYLYVAASPYKVDLKFARPATFFSAVLSRASTSSGQLPIQVTALKTGSQVGAVIAWLSEINAWSPMQVSVPGGFDEVTVGPAIFSGQIATFGIDDVRVSGNCFGFSDVVPTDSYCNAVEWLGNRGVTSGCASGQYCPGSNVTRAQMALFLNRLGIALSPTYLHASSMDGGTFDPPIYTFQTQKYTASSPKQATAHSVNWVSNASGDKTVYACIHYSNDGGNHWLPIGGCRGTMVSDTRPTNASLAVQAGPVNLAPGLPYVFSLQLYSGPPGPQPVGALVDCDLIVRIDNANSGSPPFDAAP